MELSRLFLPLKKKGRIIINLPTSHVTLSELLSLPGSQFPHYYYNGVEPVAPKYGNWAGCQSHPGGLLKIQMLWALPSESKIHCGWAGLQTAVVLVSTQFGNSVLSTPSSVPTITLALTDPVIGKPHLVSPLPHPALLTQLGQY